MLGRGVGLRDVRPVPVWSGTVQTLDQPQTPRALDQQQGHRQHPIEVRCLLVRLMRYNVMTYYSPGKTIVFYMLYRGVQSTVHPCPQSKKMSTSMSTSLSTTSPSHRGREASYRHPREMTQLSSMQSAIPYQQYVTDDMKERFNVRSQLSFSRWHHDRYS